MTSFFKKVRIWVSGAVLAVLAALGLYVQDGNTQAPTYTVTLTLPTQNIDGSALPLSQINSYTIAYKLNADPYVTKTVNGPFTSVNQTTTILKPTGTTCANAFVTANNMTSAATPDVCVTFNPAPKPPTDLAVQ